MRVTIRQSEDFEVLKALDRRCFPGDDPINPETDADVWWVAYHGDTPIAFAGLHLMVTPIPNVRGVDTGRAAYLSRCGVIPMYRGLALQRKLIRVRLRHARKHGCKRVITYTVLRNVESSRQLQKEGFLLYRPQLEWAGVPNALYWLREL